MRRARARAAVCPRLLGGAAGEHEDSPAEAHAPHAQVAQTGFAPVVGDALDRVAFVESRDAGTKEASNLTPLRRDEPRQQRQAHRRVSAPRRAGRWPGRYAEL